MITGIRLAPAAAAVGAILSAGCGSSDPAGTLPANGGLGSLPAVASGHRPGPDILHAPPPTAPQLENTGIWRADPILVSGAWAYRGGEFIYQDFLYDDHGAAGAQDPIDPFETPQAQSIPFLFAPKSGTLTYPVESLPAFPWDASALANNAADLVELRVKRINDATVFRITLNTLSDSERVAFTIAIGDSDEPREFPHGANVRAPAELFLTVHGNQAELIDAASDAPIAPKPTVSVDIGRRQFEVQVHSSAWDPSQKTVRMSAGVGLWDPVSSGYLTPQSSRTETHPGGVAPSGAAFFNVAFRFDEPIPDWTMIGLSRTLADAAAVHRADGTFWRERAQAEALRLGDISDFFAEVDFAKLAAGIDDDSGIPKTGPINRVFASRYAFGQGVDYARFCVRSGPPCEGPFVGQLQPYALYVPDKVRPPKGWGLTLWLHSWTANHNQYVGSKNQSQFGDRGAGSLVATPLARGPDGAYRDVAEADVFEVWADIARHYQLDPDWVATGGYSMGAAGGYDLPARWPDLFARSLIAAGVPEGDFMKSLRNIPVLIWIGALDEGTDVTRQEASVARLGEQGLRFVFDQFTAADHLTLATNDEWGPAADFLGEHRVERSPPRVTYIVDSRWDSARAQVVADHAYWLSDLRVRDAESNPIAEIDARSEAFGVGEPEPLGVTSSLEVLDGGAHGPMPYHRRQQDWTPAPAVAAADRLVIRATNLAETTVDVRRARLTCGPELDVTTDGPLQIHLAGCGRTVSFDSTSTD